VRFTWEMVGQKAANTVGKKRVFFGDDVGLTHALG